MKTLTIVPTGGLANRMIALAAAFSLAKKSGRQLKVIWQKDNGLNAGFNDIFRYDPNNFRLLEVPSFVYNFYYDLPRKRNLFLPSLFHNLSKRNWIYHTGNKAETMDEEFFLKEALSPVKDLVINSCYPFYFYDKKILDVLFRVNDLVEKRIEEILGNRIPAVAIQIRRTDNSLSIKNSPVSLFRQTVDFVIEENPQTVFYLATDDQSIKKLFEKEFGDKIVYNPSPAKRDTLEGIIDGMAEMEIMARCKKIYGSFSSTYSLMAAQKGDIDLIILKK